MPIHDSWSLLPHGENGGDLPVAHAVLRSILARRGVTDAESFRRFTAPILEDLHDAATIHGMAYACERIERAVKSGETILIYGDYDVDGVTSIVLLQTVLRALGGDAAFVVPQRLVDGYGLKIEVIERVLVERDVKLVITVDCGITSVEPVRRAIERGIDVIITDHHLPPGVLPEAAAVLNPKQPGCTYPFKELAGAGVAFKLCCELLRRGGSRMSTGSLLKIAAIGTIADVAPLVGENRTIAWLGLRGLAEVRNPGLRAMLRRLGIYGRPLRASDIGFKVGPRLNAAGRLASANTAIDLFAAADESSAWEICAELDRMNTRRQEIEAEVRDQAEQQVAALANGGADLPRVLILAGAGWHKGVIGLTAGRIAQKYHRPTLVMTIDGERCVGSARSIPTVNLHAQLEEAGDLFEHFGGHEFACGFSLPASNLAPLRERLHAVFAGLDTTLFTRTAQVDGEVSLAEIDDEFRAAHAMLEPFGAGNPQPLFLARRVEVTGARTFAEDCCELTLTDGASRALAVVWPDRKALAAEAVSARTIDLLFQIDGQKLVVADLRAAME